MELGAFGPECNWLDIYTSCVDLQLGSTPGWLFNQQSAQRSTKVKITSARRCEPGTDEVPLI